MVRKLAAVGIGAKIAAAPTYGAAHAMARTVANPIFLLEKDKLAGALALLPVSALRLPAEILVALKQLGFDRIEELANTPRAPLALRFGPIISQRLDQAFGKADEPFDPIVPPETPHVRCAFAEPIGAPETLARYTTKLVEQLCAELEVKGLGARKLDLLFFRVDNRIQAIRIGTAKPMRDVKRLAKLLCDKIETVDPGFGVEIMTLTALIAEPLSYRAVSSSLTEAPAPDVSGLIDKVSNRQCLSFLSFKLDHDNKLMLTVLYRNHAYIARGLGNFIGLGRLQKFVADQCGATVGSLTCVSTHAEIDFGRNNREGCVAGWTGSEANALVDRCRALTA
jgi:protein ImuB